jgi:hypothetical protein
MNKRRRNDLFRSGLMASGLWFLSGCQDFAYKQGAGAEDLKKAQYGCRTQSTDRNAYVTCMKAAGWTVGKWDDNDLLATVAPAADNRVAARAVPAPALPATALPQAQAVAAAPAGAPGAQADRIAAPSAMPRPANPMDGFEIGSWWKAGGSESDLESSVSDCAAQLGQQYRPDSPPRHVTRALLACLRERGWYGVKAGKGA